MEAALTEEDDGIRWGMLLAPEGTDLDLAEVVGTDGIEWGVLLAPEGTNLDLAEVVGTDGIELGDWCSWGISKVNKYYTS